MKYKEVKETLEKFGEAVIDSAKVNLKKNDMGGGNLFNSFQLSSLNASLAVTATCRYRSIERRQNKKQKQIGH